MFGQSLLSAFGSAACTTDTDQLFTTDVQTTSVATYQLNNATTSIPSNTYPGTPSNITYAAGKFGNAAVFNGTSSRITSGLTSGLTGSYSVSAWFTQDNISTDTAHRELISYMDANGSTGWWIGKHNNTSQWRILGVTGASIVTMTAQAGWNNIAVVKDSSTVYVYLNGSQVTSFTFPGYWNLGSGNAPQFNIGTQYTGTAEYWDGSIDQVRIFNTALPQAAVTALYNETTTTATYPYITTEGANPNSVAYYKMSDATDQLGNYNGTPTSVNFNTEGKFGFAGAFNGSSSRIAIPNIMNQAADHSVSIWIKPTNFNVNRGAISMFNGSHLLIYVTTDGGMNTNGGGSADGTTAGTITANAWNNIVVTYNYASTTYTMYVNGVNKGTSTNFNFSGRTNSIGCHNGGSSFTSYFLGSIDQIRMYDSALSAENVTTLYEEIECPAVAVTNAFNTVLYSGNSSTQAITGAGFEPDFTWIKRRDGTENHYLQDSVRGSTQQIYSNLTNSQFNETTAVTSFSANGFNMGSYNGINNSGETYVSWNWKAGGPAVQNTDGTITSQVSANVDAGFSIVKYTGNGNTAQQSYGHGLSSAPELLITKNMDTATQGTNSWVVGGTLLGNGGYMFLNRSNAKATASSYNGNKVPDSEVIYTSGTSDLVGNQNGINFITYAFHSVDGYSKIDSYVGNGSTTGPIVYVGFRPAYVMIKGTDQVSDWIILDSKRDTTNPNSARLDANNSSAEYTGEDLMDFDSNGFTLKTSSASKNGLNKVFIYLAIA